MLKKKTLGFLSIDIDGNDYWVLLEILKNKIFPEVIIVEYNASLLKHSITIPYIEDFNLYTHHSSQCYHGASLTAFNNLLSKYDYSLIKSIAGVNAVFVNNEVLKKSNFLKIDPKDNLLVLREQGIGEEVLFSSISVSYTHLTLPTIYSV